MSNLIENRACLKCSQTGEGKSLAVYENGVYCHECGYTEISDHTEFTPPKKKKMRPLIPIGEYKSIPNRGIDLSTAEKFKCTIAKYKGETVMCMSYYEKGAVVAQKIKLKKDPNNPKKPKCLWLGDKSKVPPLWGMNVFEPNAKLSVTICEGEPDMLCRSSLNDDKWPVLSLLDGAGGQALKNLAKAKEYLVGFKRIVLMFDGDESGRACAQAAVEILGPKAKIAQMPDDEDVCSLYQKKQAHLINELELTAVGHRPKDIVTVADYTDEQLYKKEGRGIEIPFPQLNNLLRGLKHSALYMFCAGSGLGKSTVAKEIAYHLMFNKGIKVGCIFLEQGDREAMKDYIAMDNYIEAEDFNQNPDLVEKEARDKSKNKLLHTGVFYKHFGSLDSATLVSKIEYMMVGCECDFVILDHISMAISGNTSTEGERKDIDILMTNLRTTIQATGKSVIAISHLKRPPGESKDYNSGGKVNLSSLRGSASLEQISDYVIALERNQFSPEKSDQIQLKVLKCRRGGRVGYADVLQYSHDTGRLSVLEIQPNEDNDDETNGNSSLGFSD